MEPTEVKLDFDNGAFKVRGTWTPDMVSDKDHKLPLPQWVYETTVKQCGEHESVCSNNDIKKLFDVDIDADSIGLIIISLSENKIALDVHLCVSYDYLSSNVLIKSSITLMSYLEDFRSKARQVLGNFILGQHRPNMSHFEYGVSIDGTDILYCKIPKLVTKE